MALNYLTLSIEKSLHQRANVKIVPNYPENQRLEFIPEVIADQPLPISSQDTVCTIGTTSSFSVQETGWPIQRFVCLLRCVELPLRKLLLEIDSLPIGLAYGIQAGSTMDGIVYWMARTFWTRALKISFRGYN
ncbi:hypothetical protein BLOT_012966 [Blomia tropicalis]|nr:hypothetical protein BLOT_012966 [Blomia tropicalis]